VRIYPQLPVSDKPVFKSLSIVVVGSALLKRAKALFGPWAVLPANVPVPGMHSAN
jgi:hypothetical protein